MIITETDRGFEISFPFDRSKIQEVKSISGAWFNGAKKLWTVPKRSEPAVQILARKYGVIDTATAAAPENFDVVPPLPDLDVELNLLKKPFPFQEKGVAYNRIHKRVIIGDQPGLGKTLQAIATITSINAFPALIICPATLKLNWKKEWLEVIGKKAMILEDRVKNTWQQYYKVGMADVFIVNYESLKKYFVAPGWSKPKDAPFRLKDIPFKETINLFKSVVIDESHKCKDGTTQQAKFVMGITKGKEYVYELTGTPVVNKPKDLIPQLVIIDRLKDIISHLPDTTGRDHSGYRRFINRYCGGGNEATNLKELNYRLNATCFYRREKSEVLKDLPAKMRQVILCEITNRKEYEKAENEFVDYLKSVRGCTDAEVRRKLRGEMMVKIGILKQISARGKVEVVRDHVDEIIDSGEKMVLFCSLREIGDALKSLYPAAVMIRGGMSPEEKDLSVRKFQTDPNTKIAICSIKAAGVGLTLTASSRVGFIEFPWTFADCEQCEDRTHRIGQEESVQASYFLGENTIDRYCYELIQKKKSIAQTITGAADDVEEEIVDQLLNLFQSEVK
jgi:SWI/SNF-related matrix-associated actin-dependent regulator 1 of chromatin subfamily A